MADPQEILSRAAPYLEAYQNASNMYGQDLATLLAQGYHESRFNPNAVSPAGAVGIAQFMPGTASDMGLTDPTNPQSAIDAQARYMQQIANQVGPDNALAAYNAGPGNVLKYGGIPPFSETQNYVRNIKNDADLLRQILSPSNAAINSAQPEAATTLPAFEKKTGLTKSEKIAAIMGALATLGGTVASTAGAFKGVPVDYGAQSTKMGASLVDSILKQEGQRGAERKLYDAIVNSDMDNAGKKDAINLLNAGFSDEALNLIKDAYGTKSAINKNIGIATDPRLLAVKKAQDAAELEQFKQKENYKTGLEQQIMSQDLQTLSALQEKDKLNKGLSNQEQVQKNILEAKYKLKGEDDSPAVKMMKDKLVENINKETGSVKSVLQGLNQMESALKDIPDGRFYGNKASVANFFTGRNPSVTKFNGALAGIESLAARLKGEVGVLTDQDLERMKPMFPQINQTKEERKVAMQNVIGFINSKIKAYRDILEQKSYGKDYLKFYDEYTNLGSFKKYLPDSSEAKPVDLYINKPEAAITPSNQSITNDDVLKMGKQLGIPIRVVNKK